MRNRTLLLVAGLGILVLLLAGVTTAFAAGPKAANPGNAALKGLLVKAAVVRYVAHQIGIKPKDLVTELLAARPLPRLPRATDSRLRL